MSTKDGRLSDRNGRVNLLGREIVNDLNQFVRTYYWWFENTEIEDPSAKLVCPNCGIDQVPFEERNFQKCETCSIFL